MSKFFVHREFHDYSEAVVCGTVEEAVETALEIIDDTDGALIVYEGKPVRRVERKPSVSVI